MRMNEQIGQHAIPRALKGALAIVALAALAGGAPRDAAAQRAQGGYTTQWDWVGHARTINYWVDPVLYQVPQPPRIIPGNPPDTLRQDSVKTSLGSAVEFAASNWSNAGTGWRFVKVAALANARLRFVPMTATADSLKKGGSWPALIEPINRDVPYPYDPTDPNPHDQPANDWLAYFAVDSSFNDPNKGGALKVTRARIVFNTDAWWDIAIGSLKYDPRTVMMHEIGHAARLEHDDTNINDDEELEPVGSRTAAANVLSVGIGADAILQTTKRGDDVIVGGMGIDSGADKVVDTSPIDGLNPFRLQAGPNAMSTEDRAGRHGVNPGANHPPGSAYSLATNEWKSAKASALDCGTKDVPTLSEWALLMLSMMLLGSGAWFIFTRRTARTA
jgi:hypothetical protein